MWPLAGRETGADTHSCPLLPRRHSRSPLPCHVQPSPATRTRPPLPGHEWTRTPVLPPSRHVPPSTGRGCSGPRAAWGPGAASLRRSLDLWARALGGAAGGRQGPGWAPRSSKGRRRRAWAPRRGCQGAAVHLPPGSPRCHPCLHQGRRTHGPPRPPSLASCPVAAVRILSVTPWSPAHSGDCPGCSPPANLGYLFLTQFFASTSFGSFRHPSLLLVPLRHFPSSPIRLGLLHLLSSVSRSDKFRESSSLSVSFRYFPSILATFRHSPPPFTSARLFSVRHRLLSSLSVTLRLLPTPHYGWRKPQGHFLPLDLFRHYPILLSLQSLVICGLPVTLSSSLHSWESGLVSPERPLPTTRPD
ncbi:uncharacterized protein [Symphalangus syndactylus]|uniref:uncharacterized protein n=1 Tax=Symphalangus syndactylus TaxID=9590 RepID=UPI0030078C98